MPHDARMLVLMAIQGFILFRFWKQAAWFLAVAVTTLVFYGAYNVSETLQR